MPRFTSQYKQRGPTTRIVAGENTYEKGMYFSEQALQPGYIHTLLNYEIDQLSYNIQVTGGLHVTDIASGCNFLDRAVFGQDSDEVVVLQGRNEYCARAFEGITNIIGVQKLSVKNNQTLAEQIRQQGFTANDVICYKVLTYNPINHRLMSVTMLQAKRDKYFIVDPKFQLRRLQINPISCGLSEVWDNADGSPYISNITDFHPNGADDHYIPRIRRNNFDQTYGQELHSPHYMQTIAHCEGFGNKTFLFTKKKQRDIIGPLANLKVVDRANIYIIRGIEITSVYNFKVDDIITMVPDRPLASYEEPFVFKVLSVRQSGNITGIIQDSIVLSNGMFTWNGMLPDTVWKHTVMRNNVNVTSSVTLTGFLVTHASIGSIIINESVLTEANTQYDIYLRNCNTGTDDSFMTQSIIKNVSVPVDAYRFGIILTSVAFLVHLYAVPTPSILDPDDLYSGALISSIKTAGTINLDKEIPSLEVNLNNGKLRILDPNNTEVAYSFKALPSIRDTNPINNPADPTTGLFKPNPIFDTNWFHPAEHINELIKNMLRIGQGFRIAVFAKSAVPLTKSLNTLRENPLQSEYYDSTPSAVWVLDYVWNGSEWEFSFVDTRKPPSITNPTLVENWESLPTTRDLIGNRITRHYIYTNCLSYTDIITKENQEDLAEHLVDFENSARLVYNRKTGETYNSAGFGLLTYNIDETLDERLGVTSFNNKSKLFDTAYGHFEATPRELTASEAARWGYNMLSTNPYYFRCADDPASTGPYLTGILLMKNGLPLLKPLVNTSGTLHLYFNSDRTLMGVMNPQIYQLKVQYKGLYDDWRTLKDFSIEETHDKLAEGAPFQIPFISPDEIVLIRAQIINTAQKTEVANTTTGELEDLFLVVSEMPTTLSYTKDPNQVQAPPNVYDLGSALGITYWKARLVAWGVLGAENQIFMSEASQPEYWPYPNNIDLFEENIVHVIPYSDALIIFTSTKVWRLDLQTDGLSWKKTLLQQNLRISDKDIPYITVLKNLLFFKSDKQFYLIVPVRNSTIGELTIAPISKPISEFLNNPFKALKSIIPPTYKELSNQEHSINEYLIKYNTHVEQMRIFVNWWFDLTAFKNQAPHIGDREVEHDVLKANPTDDNPTLLQKEYWLVQLIYDAQTYGWSLRTHTTNSIGMFISDAANIDTGFVSLIFNPELTLPDGSLMFPDIINKSFSKATWGLSIAYRRTPEENLLHQFTLEPVQNITLEPTYPRFQIFDTGYKEISSPALAKRFREIQLFLQPKNSKELIALEDDNYLQQLIENDVPNVAEEPELISPYMSATTVLPQTGDSAALKALLDVFVDGNQILTAAQPEVRYEMQLDGTLQIKITDAFSFIETPFIVDAELSNTLSLDNSALAGVQLVRFRKTINGKGQLIRMRFTNLTETNYALAGHAFIAHNKNAR